MWILLQVVWKQHCGPGWRGGLGERGRESLQLITWDPNISGFCQLIDALAGTAFPSQHVVFWRGVAECFLTRPKMYPPHYWFVFDVHIIRFPSYLGLPGFTAPRVAVGSSQIARGLNLDCSLLKQRSLHGTNRSKKSKFAESVSESFLQTPALIISITK